MRDSPRSGVKTSIGYALLFVAVLTLAYVLSTGPVTRWSPQFADKIYAPLAPLGRSPTAGRPLRAWLRLWGVKAPP